MPPLARTDALVHDALLKAIVMCACVMLWSPLALAMDMPAADATATVVTAKRLDQNAMMVTSVKRILAMPPRKTRPKLVIPIARVALTSAWDASNRIFSQNTSMSKTHDRAMPTLLPAKPAVVRLVEFATVIEMLEKMARIASPA